MAGKPVLPEVLPSLSDLTVDTYAHDYHETPVSKTSNREEIPISSCLEGGDPSVSCLCDDDDPFEGELVRHFAIFIPISPP